VVITLTRSPLMATLFKSTLTNCSQIWCHTLRAISRCFGTQAALISIRGAAISNVCLIREQRSNCFGCQAAKWKSQLLLSQHAL
jgi:hypothetical protein